MEIRKSASYNKTKKTGMLDSKQLVLYLPRVDFPAAQEVLEVLENENFFDSEDATKKPNAGPFRKYSD